MPRQRTVPGVQPAFPHDEVDVIGSRFHGLLDQTEHDAARHAEFSRYGALQASLLHPGQAAAQLLAQSPGR
ncbi:hypothetical protein [Deinococcus rubellus]|uniref:Uncharacterized protein n=1 Tax=Deinococcus rubellus TaxID=1889240 RepID=A0ABY5YLT9_9DEIO|nr:hypothetical protein [Deinococcus rubellus]UWX65067.1 hypothetical protein N0D28_05265 [Deinococcus rubellus]